MPIPDPKKPADPIKSEQPTEREGTNGKASKPVAAKKRKSRAKPKAANPEAAKTATESKPAKKRVPNPTNVRLNKKGFAALRTLEAEEPDKKRGLILSDSLEDSVSKIGSRTTIHLRRLSSEDLLALAEQIADSEKVLKNFRRNTIRARLDNATKARLVADADKHLQAFRDMRLTICRMTGIPVHSDYPADARICINALIEQKMANTSKTLQGSFETGIQILTAFSIQDDNTA